MPRRRPHPAHRTRRLIGAFCAASYVAIATAVGLHERRAATVAETATPFDTADGRATATTPTLALEPATFAFPIETTAPTTMVVPRPASPLRVAATTTLALNPTTSAAAAATSTSAPPPTTTAAPSTTSAPTTTGAPTTTITPTTTIYIRGS